MKYDEIKRKCVDCGKEFIISLSQQSFYRVRGWELEETFNSVLLFEKFL